MSKEELLAKLRAIGFEVRSEVRVQNRDRWRFMLADGTIVDSLDDGSWTVWGDSSVAVRAALGATGKLATPALGLPLVEKTNAVAEPGGNRICLKLVGRSEGDQPLTSTFFLSEQLARNLAHDLSAAAYQTRLRRRSSGQGHQPP